MRFCWLITGFILTVAGSADMLNAQTATIKPSAFSQVEKDAFVKAHNEARKEVGVEPLEWSDELATYAQQWLVQQQARLVEAATKGQPALPKHRPAQGEWAQKYGENVAAWWGSRISTAPEQAVAIWLKEKVDYDKQTADAVVGHYTQIVWKSTRRIGAARLVIDVRDARGLSRQYVAIICNYDPPGNFPGERPY
jgi:hypothetical protein